jgi:hypothetical protein
MGRPGLLGTVARTAVIAGTAQAVTGRVAMRQQQAAMAGQAQVPAPAPQAPVASAPAPGGGAGDDLIGQLERLGQLMAAGVLTPDEFATAKARLLG